MHLLFFLDCLLGKNHVFIYIFFRMDKKLLDTREEFSALERQENEQKKRRMEKVRDISEC